MSDESAGAQEAPPPEVALAAVALTVGQQLRAERERQGLLVTDVAQRLKYSPRQIEAVESEDFQAMPGLTFVRGFVRGYARLLGLDADALVRSLEASAGRESGPNTVQLQAVSVSRAQFPAATASNSAGWPWVLAIVLAVAGLGGYSLYHWQAPDEAIPRQISKAVPVPAPVATPAAAPSTVVEGPSAETPQLTQPAPTPPPAAVANTGTEAAAAKSMGDALPAAGQGSIRLVFGGESWTEIRDAQGRVVLSRNNAPGTEQTAAGEPPFDLVIGNARDVRLFYKGAEVDLAPHIKVSVARLQLK